MELTQLKYFLKTAELEHVTQAANQLHVAQPALTQSIHRLEQELGVPLFALTGRNIRLTAYGQYFYKELAPLYERLMQLPQNLNIMAKKQDSTIHLNILAASSLVTQAIIEYKRIDENLNFQLQQVSENEVFDLEITTGTSVDEKKLSKKHFIIEEKIFLAVPNVERFRNLTQIDLATTQNLGFITLSGAKELRKICDRYCDAINFKPNFIFESDNPAAVQNMIGANMGVGFWPDYSWGSVDSEKILLLPIQNTDFSRKIIIQYKKRQTENENIKAFYRFLKKYFEIAKNHEL